MRLFSLLLLLSGCGASAPRVRAPRTVSRLSTAWDRRLAYCTAERCPEYAARVGKHYCWTTYDERRDECVCVLDTPYGEEKPHMISRTLP